MGEQRLTALVLRFSLSICFHDLARTRNLKKHQICRMINFIDLIKFLKKEN